MKPCSDIAYIYGCMYRYSSSTQHVSPPAAIICTSPGEKRLLSGLVRPNIQDLTPYRCARDDYSEGVLLDANENSFGPALVATQVQIEKLRNEEISAKRGFCVDEPGPR